MLYGAPLASTTPPADAGDRFIVGKVQQRAMCMCEQLTPQQPQAHNRYKKQGCAKHTDRDGTLRNADGKKPKL